MVFMGGMGPPPLLLLLITPEEYQSVSMGISTYPIAAIRGFGRSPDIVFVVFLLIFSGLIDADYVKWDDQHHSGQRSNNPSTSNSSQHAKPILCGYQLQW